MTYTTATEQRIIGQMVTPNEAGKRRYLLFATDSDDQRISTDVHIIIMVRGYRGGGGGGR